MDDAQRIDRYSDEALLAVVDEFAGVGTDFGQSDEVRFQANVSSLIYKALAREDDGGDSCRGLAVFFLQPRPPSQLEEECKSAAMLDQGRAPLTDRICS